jgi:hypothetical protein
VDFLFENEINSKSGRLFAFGSGMETGSQLRQTMLTFKREISLIGNGFGVKYFCRIVGITFKDQIALLNIHWEKG